MLSLRSRMSPRSSNILPTSYSSDPSGKSKGLAWQRRRRMVLLLAGVVSLAVAATFAGVLSISSVSNLASHGEGVAAAAVGAVQDAFASSGAEEVGVEVQPPPPPAAQLVPVQEAREVPPARRGLGQSMGDAQDESPDVTGLEAAEGAEGPVIVLSSGNGLWNTGVWPGWGMGADITLNWAAAGVRVVKQCPVKCRFTNDQAAIPGAAAVIMELINHDKFLGTAVAEDTPIPWPARKPGSALPLFGNFFFEPRGVFPRYTSSAEVVANVDFTIAPGHADVPVTLTCPWGGSPEDYLKPAPPKAPGHAIAFFNEHGIAGEYAEFIEEFARIMGDDFHAYGQMANRPVPEEAGGNPYQLATRLQFLGTYKFHLVTEFTIEDDWIEGELSQTFLSGSVPIYLGSPNVLDHAPGEHSVISVRDFSGPADLAHYVRALLEDDTRYNTYFDWKAKGLAPRFSQHLDNCVHYAECRICKYVTDRMAEVGEGAAGGEA